MFTAIIDVLVHFVVSVIDATGLTGVVVLMALESCGIPIPSEVIMPFSGFLVSSGALNFWLVVLAGAFGNLGGSLIAYWIGFKGGRPLIERYGKYFLISTHDLNIADRWFSKQGNAMVFFGRLLPVVRTYISFPAGIARMPVGKFSLYTFLGALPWCILFTWLGVLMGERWESIRETLHNFDLAVGVVIVAAIALYVWRHIKHSRT